MKIEATPFTVLVSIKQNAARLLHRCKRAAVGEATFHFSPTASGTKGGGVSAAPASDTLRGEEEALLHWLCVLTLAKSKNRPLAKLRAYGGSPRASSQGTQWGLLPSKRAQRSRGKSADVRGFQGGFRSDASSSLEIKHDRAKPCSLQRHGKKICLN